MEINLPYSAKQALLDVLQGFVPVDVREFIGSIEIPLKQGNVGVIKYTGHVQVKYGNKKFQTPDEYMKSVLNLKKNKT